MKVFFANQANNPDSSNLSTNIYVSLLFMEILSFYASFQISKVKSNLRHHFWVPQEVPGQMSLEVTWG